MSKKKPKKLPWGASLIQLALVVGIIASALTYVVGGFWQLMPNAFGGAFFAGLVVFIDDAIVIALAYFLVKRIQKLAPKAVKMMKK